MSSSGRLNCSGSSFSDLRPNFSRRSSLTMLSSRLLRLDRIRQSRLGFSKAGLQASVLFGQISVGHDRDHAQGPRR